MKITGVKATAVSIPRTAQLKTSYGTRDGAVTVLVELSTDEGLVGIGQTAVEVPSYGESAEGILVNIRKTLAPAVIGEDPTNIEYLSKKLKTALPHHYASQAGVEFALWDLKGKALGVPVYQLLGGKVRDGVDLMGFVAQDEPSVMAAEADAILNDTPFPVLKMKIGKDPAIDIRRYRAVVEAIGDRAVIQVDGNIGYTMSQAIPALTTMAQIGQLGCVEQAVKRLDDMAELARRIPVPMMSDEAIYPPEDAIEVVRSAGATIALMKITKSGGILQVKKIASIFESAGLILSIAIYYDLIAVAAAHIAASAPSARWPSPFTHTRDTILSENFQPQGLLLKVPEKPGFGVEFDPYKVEKYALPI